MDLIVSATQTFNKLGLKPSKNPKNHADISTLEQLEECFAHHFKKCAAGERFVTSKDVFNQIVNAAKKVEGSQVINLLELYSSSNYDLKYCICRKTISIFLIMCVPYQARI